jgi:hypothetical protein
LSPEYESRLREGDAATSSKRGISESSRSSHPAYRGPSTADGSNSIR